MRTSPALVLSLALLLTPAPASAEIVYSGLWNIPIPLDFDGIYLDVDLGTTSTTETPGWDINLFFGGVGIAGSASFQPGRTGTGNEDPAQRVSAGFVIGPSSSSSALQSTFPESESRTAAVVEQPSGRSSGAGELSLDESLSDFLSPDGKSAESGSRSTLSGADADVSVVTLQYSSGPTGSYTHLGEPGNFQDGEEGYIAFRFTTNSGNGPYYGWMRVTLTGNTAGAIIHDWAWENSGGSIAAGQVPEPGFTAPLLGLAAGALLRRNRSGRECATSAYPV